MSLPAVSVVMSTRNRLASLRRSVEALWAVATAHPWELVLVDNGSRDGTREYLEALGRERAASPQPRLLTAREERRGASAARNKGWRMASAGLIAFTDDDCYVAPDYIDAVLAVFADSPDLGFASGRLLPYDPSDYRITIQESTDRRDYPPRTFIAAGGVSSANMVFRRAALERIGGFDHRLGAGTFFPCEDIDAAAAALWAGLPGAYDPRLAVYHHHGRKTEREAEALRRGYDRGRGAYFARYVARQASRREYRRAWMESARSEYREPTRPGDYPMGRSLRELWGALCYVVSGVLPGAR